MKRLMKLLAPLLAAAAVCIVALCIFADVNKAILLPLASGLLPPATSAGLKTCSAVVGTFDAAPL